MIFKKKSLSVVILIGGSGSRFSSMKEEPKQLSKLNNEHILIHIINHFKKYGLNHFILPLGLKKKYFIQFFNSKKNKAKYKFQILKKNFTEEDLDPNIINVTLFDAGKNTNKLLRIKKSLKYILRENFFVAYGDDLSNINLGLVYKKFEQNKKKKAIVTMFKKNSQYGHIVTNKRGVIKKFLEKPPYQYPINIGNYILKKSFFSKYSTKNLELENNFLPILAKKKLLLGYEHKGYFYSINDKKELLIAQKKFKKKD